MPHVRESVPKPDDDIGNVTIADVLNHSCMCLTLDAQRLQQQLEHDPSLKGLYASMALSHPHLFSRNAVFLSSATYLAIAEAVTAIERVMALPAYHDKALENAPANDTRSVQEFRSPLYRNCTEPLKSIVFQKPESPGNPDE